MGDYLSEAQNPNIPPSLPPLRNVYVYTICTYSVREEGEGGELNQREGAWGNSSQRSKITT